MISTALPQCDPTLRSTLFRGVFQAAARLSNISLLMHAFHQMLEQKIVPTPSDYQLVLQTLALQGITEHCSSVWRQVLTNAKAEALAIFSAIIEELAKRDKVEAMLCAFESMREVVATGSQKSLDHLLQQCGTALMQAAARRQHSSPALRRLLELAPEQGVCI